MKVPLKILGLLIGLSFAASVSAQTVSLTSVNATTFCPGDTITVAYTATGTFGHKNAFTIQLSDSLGNFANFRNIGSVVSGTSGTITGTAPEGPVGGHYRVRVISTNPYVIGNDNGTNISIGSIVFVNIEVSPYDNTSFTGDTVTFTASGLIPAGTQFVWNFGDDASPSTLSTTNRQATASYSTTGPKTVTIHAVSPFGCRSDSTKDTMTVNLMVLGCSPQIPANAKVDSVASDSSNMLRGNIWVNGGVDFKSSGYNVIFAEPGSSIHLNMGDIVYLKAGATVDGYYGTVIYADGASVAASSGRRHLCSSLDFDYSIAPPNVAMHRLGVRTVSQPTAAVNPNPSHSFVTLRSTSTIQSIDVVNGSGVVALSIDQVGSLDYTADISRLVAGVYYAVMHTSAGTMVERFIVE